MANYTSTHTGAVIDASVTKVSSSGVTQADLSKLNAVTSTAVELNLLDGVTATTAELNILDGVTATAIELNYLDGADSSITTLSLPDNTTITTFGASLIDDADAATARTTLGVDIAGTDNSTDVTLVTTSHDYLSLSGQAITLGQIDISDDTNLVAGDGLALTVDTLSVNVDNSSIETNLDTLRVKALGITNAMLAGSIANSKLSNSSVSYGGVSVALGSSDATPAFNLSDATSLPIVAGTTGTLSVARGGTGATTASGARTNLNVDVAGTDNSTDVTLVTTSHDYLSLTGQAITLGQIDISDDTNLVGGTGITLTGDTLSTTDSEIVHDNLSGFVANEHIDHSGVSITAGAGLTGGGDITATRDIAVGAGTGVTVNADDVAIGQDVATTADVTFNSVTADIIGDIRGATKFSAKADVALNKGDAVYISGVSGTTPTVNIADANDSTKMPSFGLAASSVSINASVEIITFGTLAGINTSAFSVGDIIYISTNGTSGNTLTATAPSGETSLIQNIGKVQRSHATAGSIKVGGAGRSNATPNLNDGNIFIGNGSNQAVTASLNTKIESYLDGGTSTANFDTISVDGAEITATPAELNVLDGITSTTAELNYTDGVTSNIQTQLDAKAPLASPAFTGTATGANLTLSGDLTVNGSTTTLDTTNLAVEDNLMELNAGVTSNANDSGFLIERGTTGDNAIFMWDESADKFTLGTTTATGTTTGDIILSSTGTLVASLEGNVTGDVTGNADTATTLATARNFSLTGDVTAGAVSFDGSGNVALSTTIAANSVALGTDTTGNYMSDLTEGTGIDITHTPAEGSNATIALDLTEVGFGGGANRLITDDGDGTVSTEANLTFDGSTLAVTGDLNVGSGDLFVDDSAGRVGIGTTSPQSKLNINVAAESAIPSAGNDTNFLMIGNDGSGSTNYGTMIGTLNTGNGYIQQQRFDGTATTYNLLLQPNGGNVGIGTNSPSAKLHIAEGFAYIYKTNDVGKLELRDSRASYDAEISQRSDGRISLATRAGTYGSNGSIEILDSGNVGIGTASPGEKLEVSGNIKTTSHLVLPYGEINDAGTDLNIVGTNAVTLQSSAGTALTIPNASTNVGIGTTSPSRTLDVDGIIRSNTSGGRFEAISGTSGTGYYIFGDSGDLDIGWISYEHTNNAMAFKVNASERMRIDSSGNVGIGTTSPGALLDVNGTGYIRTAVFSDAFKPYSGTLATYGSSSSTDHYFVGDVGIGTTSPGYKLDVNGTSGLRDNVTIFDDKTLYVGSDLTNGLRLFHLSSNNNNYIRSNGGALSVQTIAAQPLYLQTNNANAMTIDSSQNVGIGTTSPAVDLHILDTGGHSQLRIETDNVGSGAYLELENTTNKYVIGNVGGDLVIDESGVAERLRIKDTTGNVLIGTTNTGWDGDADNLVVGSGSGNNGMTIYAGSTSFSQINFADSNSGAGRYTGVVRYNHNTNDMSFHTNDGAVAMTIDAQRNLKFADNGTNPSASANIAYLFNDGGELKVLDELGNTTTISPHNFSLIPGGASEDRAWGYYSEKDIVDDEGNVTATQKVNVDMMKLARLVEELTGEKLVYTEED